MDNQLPRLGLRGRYPPKSAHVDTMPDSNNPYSSPQTEEPRVLAASSYPRSYSHSKGILAASVIVGGLATAVAMYLIYVDDPRTNVQGSGVGPKLEVLVLGGAAVSSVIWALSGWLQRRGVVGLAKTFITAYTSAGLWIIIFGTDADTMAAAAYCGWPCGGLVASIFGYLFTRLQHASLPQGQDGV